MGTEAHARLSFPSIAALELSSQGQEGRGLGCAAPEKKKPSEIAAQGG